MPLKYGYRRQSFSMRVVACKIAVKKGPHYDMGDVVRPRPRSESSRMSEKLTPSLHGCDSNVQPGMRVRPGINLKAPAIRLILDRYGIACPYMLGVVSGPRRALASSRLGSPVSGASRDFDGAL
jgi:hypothetical protein